VYIRRELKKQQTSTEQMRFLFSQKMYAYGILPNPIPLVCYVAQPGLAANDVPGRSTAVMA
jgi:hypothetical protein